MKLTPVQQKFILHWGEMGTRWGINRTVAQIHALLYLAANPLPAEEISTTLGVARSNVSTSLRELEGWGIVRVVHLLGDRRDHFVTMSDVWEMFRIILEERKRREIDPTLAVLRECVEQARGNSPAEVETRERLQAMLDFLEAVMSLYEEARRLPAGALRGLAKWKGKMGKLLPIAGGKSSAAGEAAREGVPKKSA
jgi:DNA-binding transcriptional regulator GbsR (MarR family)